VPQGGNYDGAAGVVAGLSAIAGLRARSLQPPRDVTIMAIRAEEAAWGGVYAQVFANRPRFLPRFHRGA